MLFLIFAAYLVVCYLIARLFVNKQTDARIKRRNSLIITFFLAIFGLAGLIYWDHSSKRCAASDRPISISEIAGKWKTKIMLIEINRDGTFQSEYLEDASLKKSGTLTIEGSLLKFHNTKYNGGDEIFEVCEVTGDKMLYHNFSHSLSGDSELKSVASRVR